MPQFRKQQMQASVFGTVDKSSNAANAACSMQHGTRKGGPAAAYFLTGESLA
jgi:hypothetical protein